MKCGVGNVLRNEETKDEWFSSDMADLLLVILTRGGKHGTLLLRTEGGKDGTLEVQQKKGRHVAWNTRTSVQEQEDRQIMKELINWSDWSIRLINQKDWSIESKDDESMSSDMVLALLQAGCTADLLTSACSSCQCSETLLLCQQKSVSWASKEKDTLLLSPRCGRFARKSKTVLSIYLCVCRRFQIASKLSTSARWHFKLLCWYSVSILQTTRIDWVWSWTHLSFFVATQHEYMQQRVLTESWTPLFHLSRLVSEDIPLLKPTIMAGVPRVYNRLYGESLEALWRELQECEGQSPKNSDWLSHQSE